MHRPCDRSTSGVFRYHEEASPAGADRGQERVRGNGVKAVKEVRACSVMQTKCVSFLSQIPEKTNLKEEIFLLVHGFRDFNPWLTGFKEEMPCRRVWWSKAAHLMATQKQKKRWGR